MRKWITIWQKMSHECVTRAWQGSLLSSYSPGCDILLHTIKSHSHQTQAWCLEDGIKCVNISWLILQNVITPHCATWFRLIVTTVGTTHVFGRQKNVCRNNSLPSNLQMSPAQLRGYWRRCPHHPSHQSLTFHSQIFIPLALDCWGCIAYKDADVTEAKSYTFISHLPECF